MKHMNALSKSPVQPAQLLVPDSIKIAIAQAILGVLAAPAAAKDAAQAEA